MTNIIFDKSIDYSDFVKRFLIVALFFIVESYVFNYSYVSTYIKGHSMEPTIKDGSSLGVNEIVYTFCSPKRYDVISAWSDNYKAVVCKRIYGLPGETIYISEDNQIIVNSEVVEDPYGFGKTYAGNASAPYTLGKDEYFVLGDNREISADSRSDQVGLIKRNNIVGKLCI